MLKNKVTKFEDMPVWNDAQDFAVSIYSLTKAFPKDELYGLTSQMRRASSSVSANIAEGFGRNSLKDMLHFYKIAYGSLLETKNFIYLARRLDYVSVDVESDLINASVNLQKQLNGINKYFNNHE